MQYLQVIIQAYIINKISLKTPHETDVYNIY